MRTRKYARKNILKSDSFLATAKEIYDNFPKGSWVLIGGLAVSHYSNPPVTVDVDVFFDDTLYDVNPVLDKMRSCGWVSRPLRFPHRQRGLPRRGVALDCDNPPSVVDILFTGNDKFLRKMVKTGSAVLLSGGLEIPVVSAENLIVMKSLVGRDKDLDDIADLYRTLGSKLDDVYIQKTLDKLE